MGKIFEKVYEIVKKIPRGKVLTYGDVATLLGNIKYSRVVGYALHVNPEPITIPCHRIVNKNGELSSAFAFGGLSAQKTLLESEGVIVNENKVDLSIFRANLQDIT